MSMEEDEDTLVLVEVCATLIGAIFALAMERISSRRPRAGLGFVAMRLGRDGSRLVCLSKARQHPLLSPPCPAASSPEAPQCQAPSGRAWGHEAYVVKSRLVDNSLSLPSVVPAHRVNSA